MDLALFDFDGTITTRETFADFVRMATPRWRLRVGGALLASLVAGRTLGLVQVSTLRAAVAWVAFKGVRADDVARAGERFARDVIPGLLRDEAMQRIAWHRARGDRIVVVSGGFDAVLAPWCAVHGLDLIASQLESRGGVLTGRYRGAQCASTEKCNRVRARFDLGAYARIHAYGDTHEDLDLLALAHERTYRWQPAPAHV